MKLLTAKTLPAFNFNGIILIKLKYKLNKINAYICC